MAHWMHQPLLLVGCLLGAPALAESPEDVRSLPEPFLRLMPLHQRLAPPQPGEWLAEHPEQGQTYRQYVGSRPTVPDRQRRVIYVQPLGDFTPGQRRIVSAAADYLHAFFDLPVVTRDHLSLEVIPRSARRPGTGQVLTTYVLDKVLKARLPKDAMASIAFTSADLWPGEGWNFVFGQASLSDRVGLWSIHRFGNPDESKEGYQRCLRRTLACASHETAHMFSLPHCTLFECNICGSNSLAESDRRPTWLCPHCLAKLCWATGMKPARHYERLAAAARALGLDQEQAFYEKSLARLQGK